MGPSQPDDDPAAPRTTGRLTGLAVTLAGAGAVAAALLVPSVLFDASRTSAPSVQSPSALVGRWERSVPGSGAVAGRWRLTLDRSGGVDLVPPAGTAAAGAASYSVDGEQLRIDAFVAGECSGKPFGVYRWRVSGSTLRLTSLSDACAERAAVFEGSWDALEAS